jgi:sulfur carrier protein
MIIYINDKPLSLETSCTLQDMLAQREQSTAHMAIAINNQFIPNSRFANTFLQEGDRIDLVIPMQGG